MSQATPCSLAAAAHMIDVDGAGGQALLMCVEGQGSKLVCCKLLRA
jgi:hypothetical protein